MNAFGARSQAAEIQEPVKELGPELNAEPGPVSASTLPLAVYSLEKLRLQCYIVMMLADIAAVVGGFGLGALTLARDGGLAHALLQSQLLLPPFLTVALYNGSYSLGALRARFAMIMRPAQALAVAALAMALIAYLAKTGGDYSRLVFVAGLIGAALMLIVSRWAMFRFVRWSCGGRVENVLIVRDGGPPIAIDGAFVIDASAAGFAPDLNDPVALDHLGQWLSPMDRVIVCCTDESRFAWAQALKGLAVEGEVIDRTVTQLGALGARHYGSLGALRVSQRPLGLRSRALKRSFDLAVSIPAVIVLAPLMLAVAVAIRLQDGGPALFVQQRTGRGSRFFRIYKFRSMRWDQADATGTLSASRIDSRVTPIGRLIRRTSIDELPQLLNVLKGDMSLVGPRPHAIRSQAGNKLFWEVDDRYWQRHTLKPGLTGLAQIRGHRGATETEDDLLVRLQSDLEYLDGWTIWRDVGILFATLRVIVHDRAF